jgi:AcrR family transcriptional regulator
MADQDGTYHHGDLRAALLSEAASMIAEGGAASLTMREIGRRLGVSRAAPYRHFEDKSALLVAVAAAGFDRLKRRLEATEADAPLAGADQLRRIGEEYVRFALENPAHYRLMYGKEALTREDLPDLKREDPRAQAYVAWSAVHGLASLVIEGQIMAPVDVDGLVRQTTGTLLDGMRVTA